jgi:hypothetical protein
MVALPEGCTVRAVALLRGATYRVDGAKVVDGARLVDGVTRLGVIARLVEAAGREAVVRERVRGAAVRDGAIRVGALRLIDGADRLAVGALRLIDRVDRLIAGARLETLGALRALVVAGRLDRTVLALPTLARPDERLAWANTPSTIKRASTAVRPTTKAAEPKFRCSFMVLLLC